MTVMQPTETSEPLIVPVCAIFRRFLKKQGLKFTPERAKILDTTMKKQGVFEAEQLLHEMREAGHRVSRATIYRTLKHLLEANIITEVLIDSKLSHFQLAFGREQKSHLVCAETNSIKEFSAPQLAEIMRRVCAEHGYEPVSYRFVAYGVSPEARVADSDK